MPDTTGDSLAILSRAVDQTEAVLSKVPRDALSEPTPCPGWDVRQLVAHIVSNPQRFVMMARGEEPDWAAQPPLPDDWTAEFRANGDELLQSWRDAGPDAQSGQMDFQTAELAIHTWDLARATDQSTDLDPEVAERGLAFMSAALTPENREPAFGREVDVPADAPVYERLVAFAGRDPRSH